jgi:DNA-binding PadR family transcriptional regulator
MTNGMRSALEAASKHALRRVHDGPGAPPWPAHSASLAALVRRGYLERSQLISRKGHRVDLWTLTDEGREALKPQRLIGSERPVFMARGSGVTSERAMAIDDAEVMGAPSEAWLRVARERRAGVEDPRRAAKRLARSLRAA